MYFLKMILIRDFILQTIDFLKNVNNIILTVNILNAK